MTEIVPAINVADFDELKKRIALAARKVHLVHIDVADGTFTPSSTWFNPEDLRTYEPPAQIEIHFMVANPEKKISPWFMPQVRRIIFHVEATADSGGVITLCHKAHCEAGVAVRPDTPYEKLLPFKDLADMLQVLAVMPGPSGQQFDARSLAKIAALRAASPAKLIEIDGGITVGVARECAAAGANLLVAGSVLFGSGVDFDGAFSRLSDDISAFGS